MQVQEYVIPRFYFFLYIFHVIYLFSLSVMFFCSHILLQISFVSFPNGCYVHVPFDRLVDRIFLVYFGKTYFLYWGVSSWCNGSRDELRNRSTRVRTPVALLCSLSGKYPWERYEPPYSPSSYG